MRFLTEYDQRWNILRTPHNPKGEPCSDRFRALMAGERAADPVLLLARMGGGEGVYVNTDGVRFRCYLNRGRAEWEEIR